MTRQSGGTAQIRFPLGRWPLNGVVLTLLAAVAAVCASCASTPEGIRLYRAALDNRSTAPNYVKVTVGCPPLHTNRTICVETLDLLNALRAEMQRVDGGIDTSIHTVCSSCGARIVTRLEAEPPFLFPNVRL